MLSNKIDYEEVFVNCFSPIINKGKLSLNSDIKHQLKHEQVYDILFENIPILDIENFSECNIKIIDKKYILLQKGFPLNYDADFDGILDSIKFVIMYRYKGEKSCRMKQLIMIF